MPSGANKRLVILTDSLGCPRDEVAVDMTWVDRFIRAYGNEYIVYTQCKHGLSSSSIDWDYILELNPDIIIVQLGIVDACRRAFPRLLRSLLNRFPPVLSNPIFRFASHHHFELTKLFEFRINSYSSFIDSAEKLTEISSEKTIFLSIAKPGDFLIAKTYSVDSDVCKFNVGLKCVCDGSEGGQFIDPYGDIEKKLYLLEDGHHLNTFGHDLVFRCLSDYFENSSKGKRNCAREEE